MLALVLFYAQWGHPYTATHRLVLRVEWSLFLCLRFGISSLEPGCPGRGRSFNLQLLASNVVEGKKVLEEFLRFHYLVVMDPPVG